MDLIDKDMLDITFALFTRDPERNGEKPTIIVDQDKAALVNDVVDILAKNDAAKQTTAIIGKSLAECGFITKHRF